MPNTSETVDDNVLQWQDQGFPYMGSTGPDDFTKS